MTVIKNTQPRPNTKPSISNYIVQASKASQSMTTMADEVRSALIKIIRAYAKGNSIQFAVAYDEIFTKGGVVTTWANIKKMLGAPPLSQDTSVKDKWSTKFVNLVEMEKVGGFDPEIAEVFEL